jgi:acetoin utilization deacetylase AcuC-like enzyme
MLKIAWHPCYALEVPAGHRFPMEKYDLLPEQLIREGTITDENLFNPDEIDENTLLFTHSASYVQKLNSGEFTPQELRRFGLPYSPKLVERERIITAGTLQSALYAIEFGIAMNIAGGTHHAFRDSGEGFCIFNDFAVAANYLIKNKIAERILIVDLDVHQGNGTAKLFSDKPEVFTFSMHGVNNYPLKKEISDLDIPLPDKTTDSEYLKLLDQNLSRIFYSFHPDFVFYQSGVDILETDKLGKLSVSLYGCKERDKFVLSLCQRNNVPVVCSMGGGYSPDIRDIIEAHANTFRLAREIYF